MFGGIDELVYNIDGKIEVKYLLNLVSVYFLPSYYLYS